MVRKKLRITIKQNNTPVADNYPQTIINNLAKLRQDRIDVINCTFSIKVLIFLPGYCNAGGLT